MMAGLPGPGSLSVKVGVKLQFTREEERELQELASMMHRLAVTRDVGWRVAFVRSLTLASKVVSRAVERSHRSLGA